MSFHFIYIWDYITVSGSKWNTDFTRGHIQAARHLAGVTIILTFVLPKFFLRYTGTIAAPICMWKNDRAKNGCNTSCVRRHVYVANVFVVLFVRTVRVNILIRNSKRWNDVDISPYVHSSQVACCRIYQGDWLLWSEISAWSKLPYLAWETKTMAMKILKVRQSLNIVSRWLHSLVSSQIYFRIVIKQVDAFIYILIKSFSYRRNGSKRIKISNVQSMFFNVQSNIPWSQSSSA